MLQTIREILDFPYTSIGCALLYGVADNLLREWGLLWLSGVLALILGIAAVISFLMNLYYWGNGMKVVHIILCFVILFGAYTNLQEPEPDYDTPYSSGSEISFGSSGDCNSCHGSRECRYCDDGMKYCRSSYCNRGNCTACDDGVYNNRSCSMCRGDGMCDRCRGTGYVDCSVCDGSGRCTRCD